MCSSDLALSASAAAFAAVEKDAAQVPTPLPQGALPAGIASGAAALDAAVHAWDIAVATGRKSPIGPALAEVLLAVAKEIVEPLRPFGAYAPALAEVPDGDAVGALLRYLGRDPEWAV